MPVTTTVQFQIGKNGINEGTLESLALAFKNHKVVRIKVLRSTARDKAKVKEMADEIVTKLGGNFVYTLIGFTIVLRRRGQLTKK